jgi:hypothetical protein
VVVFCILSSGKGTPDPQKVMVEEFERGPGVETEGPERGKIVSPLKVMIGNI